MKKITLLICLLSSHLFFAMDNELQEIRTRVKKLPKSLQQFLAAEYHGVHDWKHIPWIGCSYIIANEVPITGKKKTAAHPWRYTLEDGVHKLQFRDSKTNKLTEVAQETFPDNIECHHFQVIGPNDNSYAIINNSVICLNDPSRSYALSIRHGETISCIHSKEPLCASYDAQGDIYLYDWSLSKYCYTTIARETIRRKKLHLKKQSTEKSKIVSLDFGADNQLLVLSDSKITILDHKKNIILKTIDADQIIPSHTIKPGHFACITNFAICPTQSNLLLLSYRIFSLEKPAFIAELLSGTKYLCGFYDVSEKIFLPCDVELKRRDGKIAWSKKLQSYQRREIHNCEPLRAKEQPEHLEKSLMYLKNGNQMLNTLNALFERIEQTN